MQVSLSLFFSVVTVAVSGIFAVLVLRRWAGKHRPHLLAWGIGLTLYFVASLAQVILRFTWSQPVFALWYWCGALAVAPWLGQGTIYLLVRRGSIARNVQMALLLVCVMTLPWALFLTPMDGGGWRPDVDLTAIINDVMQAGGVRKFVPVMNVWGTVALVGGAIYSAALFRRKQIMRNRVVGNLFIAAGGLLPAFGGALIRLDVPELKYFGDMMGAILIFVGFMIATNIPEETNAPRQRESLATTTD
jgi:hypothetical protein